MEEKIDVYAMFLVLEGIVIAILFIWNICLQYYKVNNDYSYIQLKDECRRNSRVINMSEQRIKDNYNYVCFLNKQIKRIKGYLLDANLDENDEEE